MAHAAKRARVVDRVQYVEKLDRLVTAAQMCDRHHGPERGVRVLAAVLGAFAARAEVPTPASVTGRSS